jgi:hypothetical protein
MWPPSPWRKISGVMILTPFHDPAQVDTQGAIPRFEIRVECIAAATDACVVTEHVNLAELANGFVRCRTQLVAVTNVGVQEMHTFNESNL